MGWPQLADAIVDRRTDMGFHTREALLAHLDERGEGKGLSRRVLADLETGRRSNYDQSTLRRLEQVLGWEQGTATRIVRGDTPPLTADAGSLVGLSMTSSQVIALLDRDDLILTGEERATLAKTIDLVMRPYVLLAQRRRRDADRRFGGGDVAEGREGAGG